MCVHVAGGDGVHLQRLGEVAQGCVAAHVAAFVRTLDLDEEAVAAEGAGDARCRVRVAHGEPVARAAGEADETVVQLLEPARVERRRQRLSSLLRPRARMSVGDEPAEVRVALRRLDEQGHVRAAVEGQLGARDRPDAEVLRRVRELERAVDPVVIGERERRVPELGRPRRKLFRLGRSVEKGVRAVGVELDVRHPSVLHEHMFVSNSRCPPLTSTCPRRPRPGVRPRDVSSSGRTCLRSHGLGSGPGTCLSGATVVGSGPGTCLTGATVCGQAPGRVCGSHGLERVRPRDVSVGATVWVRQLDVEAAGVERLRLGRRRFADEHRRDGFGGDRGEQDAVPVVAARDEEALPLADERAAVRASPGAGSQPTRRARARPPPARHAAPGSEGAPSPRRSSSCRSRRPRSSRRSPSRRLRGARHRRARCG